MLAALPAEIGQLRKLRLLEAYKNDIKVLPIQISGLVSLECLNLFNCQLTRRTRSTPRLLLGSFVPL